MIIVHYLRYNIPSTFGSLVLLTWTTPADIGSVGIVLTKEMQNHAEILLMQISALLMMGHLDLIGRIFLNFLKQFR